VNCLRGQSLSEGRWWGATKPGLVKGVATLTPQSAGGSRAALQEQRNSQGSTLAFSWRRCGPGDESESPKGVVSVPSGVCVSLEPWVHLSPYSSNGPYLVYGAAGERGC
jgi:hypothetical protein